MERDGLIVAPSSSTAQATVLLLGWEGAKPSPLLTCARLYKDLNFHIIAASVLSLDSSYLSTDRLNFPRLCPYLWSSLRLSPLSSFISAIMRSAMLS